VGRNPLSIVVPCHRVLGHDGGLTGYAGGLDRKAALLRLEGAPMRNKQAPMTNLQDKSRASASLLTTVA
jgi:methylated-DNA-[protein]-cysteine S-methyltransferase